MITVETVFDNYYGGIETDGYDYQITWWPL